jgi:CubicO group peptidase (beta-lactamase class C family)
MKTRRFAWAVLLAAALACLGCGTVARIDPDYWPGKEIARRQPRALGLDPAKLGAIDTLVSSELPRTASVIVRRHGYIAYEKYFQGRADTERPVWSATKSVISLLMGIHLGDQWTQSIDKPITALLPEMDPQGTGPASRITLRSVLTMTSGLPDDGGVGQLDPRMMAIRLEQVTTTGTGPGFGYNGTNADLVSLAISRSRGMSAAQFAREALFAPLGITRYTWDEMNGVSRGAWGLNLTAPDMARLGYLYLRKGRWGDKQVVPASWVEESTRTQSVTGDTGGIWQKYGFLWWIQDFSGHPGFNALGMGGQIIAVMPDLDMVVVVATIGEGDEPKYFAIIEECVIPSVLAGSAGGS